MSEKVLLPVERNRNRCIGCVYLFWGAGDQPTELHESSRLEIVSGKWVGSGNYENLACIKDLRTPDDLRDHVLNAICPRKGWRPYKRGTDPMRTYQREQHRKTLKWTIFGAIAAAAATLFAILNLLFDFVN